MLTHELTIQDQQGRIDKVLAEAFPDLTRSHIQSLIKEERILVNGESVKNKYQVKSGDRIEVQDLETQPIALEPEDIPLDIVYEDEDVIVVNKHQGMVVHPAAGHPNHTLQKPHMFHSQ